MIDTLSSSPWQMTFGERAAMEGLLGQLHPRLAIEIGTAEGGSLRRLAEHSEHVHSFDLIRPHPALEKVRNVSFHTGDCHALLPELLGELATNQENVDFVLVDGDHSADGVERDIRDLIGSRALRRTIILAHDTMNDEVRRGLQRIDFDAEPSVVFADLDFISGHLSRGGDFNHQLWGGLGLIVVDDTGSPLIPPGREGERFYDLFELVSAARDEIIARDSPSDSVGRSRAGEETECQIRERSMRAERELTEIRRSVSWRITAPLRSVKRALRAP